MCCFTGVVDKNGIHAATLVKKHDISVLSLKPLLDVSDAVVIASDARAILTLAKAKNLTVQVGHQERKGLHAIGLDKIEERLLKIEVVRNAVYSVCGTDTSVTFDLMTHDIDYYTALLGGAASKFEGQSGVIRSRHG